jgi:hypothetical protein
MRRWLQRALQRFLFAPDSNVYICGVRAEACLVKDARGRALVAVDSLGNVGFSAYVKACDLVSARQETRAQLSALGCGDDLQRNMAEV